MSRTEYAIQSVHTHPIRIGVAVVVGVLAVGSLAGFLLGYGNPISAAAQIIVTAPAPIVAPPPPIVPIAPVVVAPVIPVTTVNSGSSNSSKDGDEIVVTGQKDKDTNTPPCCTTINQGHIPGIDVDTNTPPCCTVHGSTPSTNIPPTTIPPTTIPPTTPPPSSSCISLTSSSGSVNSGDTITLTWKAKNVNQITITDIGTITGSDALAGSRTVTVTDSKTYYASVPGDTNNPHCNVPITVNHQQVPGCISLTASKTNVQEGDSVTLTWAAKNVNQITITDIGIINGAEALGGSRTITATTSKTYYASVPGDEHNPHCQVPVTVNHNQPSSSCIALTASETEINKGDSVTLTWTAKNADEITITDIGTITGAEANGGSRVVTPTADQTYTASVPGDENNPHCRVTVHIKPPHTDTYSCNSLAASASEINKGDTVTLTWSADKGPVTITNVTTGDTVIASSTASGTVDVKPDEDTTYHASIPEDTNNSNCTVSVDITTGGGGGGGGSSHHSSKPKVYLSSEGRELPPLSSVYLSQIPYTGLDLGPVGTVVYWTLLVIWSLALAYLVLFGGLPLLRRKLTAFGANVRDAVNSAPAAPANPGYTQNAHAMPATSVPAAHAAPAYAAAAHPAPAARAYATAAPAPRMEMTGEGFKRFASTEALTIDDIVKGLSRESGMQLATEPAPAAREEAPAPVAPAYEAPKQQIAERAMPQTEATQAHPEVTNFIAAILEGERDVVFGTIRRLNQAGHDVEEFVSHAILALDDAYKARIDGTPVHEDVARVTDHCATPFLERLVSALTTAVDGSYSMGVTGVKLALTRALAVAQG